MLQEFETETLFSNRINLRITMAKQAVGNGRRNEKRVVTSSSASTIDKIKYAAMLPLKKIQYILIRLIVSIKRNGKKDV